MKELEDRYSFTMRQSDGVEIKVSSSKQKLDDVLEDFKTFLIACGYSERLVETMGYER